MPKLSAAVAALCLLSLPLAAGAVDLLPDYAAIEYQHTSHISQHEPFTDTPTNYGSDVPMLALGWQRGPWRFEIADGYNLDPPRSAVIAGPRETFAATVSYQFSLKGI
jgi:hypothetical protein